MVGSLDAQGRRKTVRWLEIALVIALGSTACGGDDDASSFSYGVGEMRSAIEGTWEGTSRTSESGTEAPITMTLAYVSSDTKPQCTSRLLSRDERESIGPRCIDMSTISVNGKMVARFSATETARERLVQGTFDVMSLKFDGHGMLSILADNRHLEATLTDDLLEGSVHETPDSSAVTFSLHRRK